jgi:hypothetical protein
VLGLRRHARNLFDKAGYYLISGTALRLLGVKIAGRNEKPGVLGRFLVQATQTVRADEEKRAAVITKKKEANKKPTPTPTSPPPTSPQPTLTPPEDMRGDKWLDAVFPERTKKPVIPSPDDTDDPREKAIRRALINNQNHR